jgi:2-polyprenyl-6-methoxyphenol hydroxylase and related FAD-dependent oxidoreductases
VSNSILLNGETPLSGKCLDNTFDVVIVGAGIAGCTAARLFALEGFRVALVEHHVNTEAFKQLCTHFIQASATPTMRRLGLDRLIEDAGAIRNCIDIWTRYGWIGNVSPVDENGEEVFGYNVQRSTLDPILRRLAIQTPGVTNFLGCHVQRLVEQQGEVTGVELAGVHSGVLVTRLIVGADGRNSPLATIAGVKPVSSTNTRFGALATYRGVPLVRGTCSQMWMRGPEMGYIFPNDDGITVVTYLSAKDVFEQFHASPRESLMRAMAGFPDAPDLSAATPIGQVLMVKDYPNLRRRTVVRNIAFAGDALMSVDFLPGVGCGFAFQTAEWLVDALAPALRGDGAVSDALNSYARNVSRKLQGHRFFIHDFARRRKFNVLERVVFAAAAKDDWASRHLHNFAARLIGPAQFFSPQALLRLAWISLSRPASRSAQRDAPV